MNLKKWLVATRPWSIPASAAPAVVVCAWLLAANEPVCGPLAVGVILGAILFQLAANLISDYFDFTSGVDTLETAGSRTLPEGIFPPGTILLFGLILLAVASVLGLFLAYQSGPWLLAIGGAGVLATGFYYVVKFRGGGVFLIFAVFGPGIALGTEYALTGRFSWSVLGISIPIGSLTTAILHANDLRDMPHDRSAHIRTFSLALGQRGAKRFFVALLILPYLFVLILVLSEVFPPTAFLAWLTLPIALKNIRRLDLSKNNPERLNDLDQRTAALQTLFSLSLLASVVIG